MYNLTSPLPRVVCLNRRVQSSRRISVIGSIPHFPHIAHAVYIIQEVGEIGEIWEKCWWEPIAETLLEDCTWYLHVPTYVYLLGQQWMDYQHHYIATSEFLFSSQTSSSNDDVTRESRLIASSRRGFHILWLWRLEKYSPNIDVSEKRTITEIGNNDLGVGALL